MELALVVYLIEVLTTTGFIPFFLGFFCIIIFVGLLIAYKRGPISTGTWILDQKCKFGEAGEEVVIKDYNGYYGDSIVNLRKDKTHQGHDYVEILRACATRKTTPNTINAPPKWLLIVAMFFWAYAAYVPTKDTATKMVAAYVVQQVATNDKVQDTVSNSYKVVEKFIGDYLEESEKPSEETPAKVETSVDPVAETAEPIKVDTTQVKDNIDKVGQVAGKAIDTFKQIEQKLNQ